MNQPDRNDRFVVPAGEKKVLFERDTKLPNTGTFTIQREDHTLGNLLRMQLLDDRGVLFAGYRIPHPLEYRMLVRVQTMESHYPPEKAMQAALNDLQSEVAELQGKLEAELRRVPQERVSDDGMGGPR